MPELRRPSFCEPFPRTAALDALVEAFARGDFARVRADAPALESAEDETVRAAARTLVERTRPDPLAVGLMGITAALLVVLAGWWLINGKPPAGAKPAAPTVEHVGK